MHQKSNIMLKQDRIREVIQGVEMLKAIEIEFKTKKYMINQWVVLINRYTSEQINQIVDTGMRNLFKQKKGQQFEENLYLMNTIIACL